METELQRALLLNAAAQAVGRDESHDPEEWAKKLMPYANALNECLVQWSALLASLDAPTAKADSEERAPSCTCGIPIARARDLCTERDCFYR